MADQQQCRRCGVVKDASIRFTSKFICKDCGNKQKRERYRNDPDYRAKVIDRARDHASREGSRDKRADWMLRRLYGITLDQKAQLYLEQDGRCASCLVGAASGDLCVDHCHDTDIARGLLCHPCNLSLGMMHESPENLRALAVYADRCQALKRRPDFDFDTATLQAIEKARAQ